MVGDKVKLDQTEYNLPAIGGDVKVSFVPLSSWSVSCSDSFVKINPSSGLVSEDPVTLVIRVEENKDPQERTIKVLLTFETNDIVLTIKQAGAVPDAPDNPDNPDTPDNPDNPDNPDDPDNPDIPDDWTGSTDDVLPGDGIGTDTK